MTAADRRKFIKRGDRIIQDQSLQSEQDFEDLKQTLVDVSFLISADFREQRGNFLSDGARNNWDRNTGYQQNAWDKMGQDLEGINPEVYDDWDEVRNAVDEVWSRAQP